METTNTHSSTIAKTYKGVGVLFLILSVVSFVPALIFFASGFSDKAIFLLGYALLNLLFAYGLWKRQQWMVVLSLINFVGIFIAKAFGFFTGITSGLNFLATVLIVAIFTGFIYSTRSSLNGKRGVPMPVLVVFLFVLISVLLRAVKIL